MKQIRLLPVTFALLLAIGCSDSTTDSGNSAAAGGTGEAVERLLADAPEGWKEVFSSSNPGLRMVEFIPDDQQNASWTQKITFESLSGNPLPDPEEGRMVPTSCRRPSVLCGPAWHEAQPRLRKWARPAFPAAVSEPSARRYGLGGNSSSETTNAANASTSCP